MKNVVTKTKLIVFFIKMKYKVITSSSPEGLAEKINTLMENGYRLLGGVIVNVVRQQNRYSGTQHMDTINTLEYVQSVYKDD